MKQFCGHLVSSHGQSTIKVNHLLVLLLENLRILEQQEFLAQLLVFKKKKGWNQSCFR